MVYSCAIQSHISLQGVKSIAGLSANGSGLIYHLVPSGVCYSDTAAILRIIETQFVNNSGVFGIASYLHVAASLDANCTHKLKVFYSDCLIANHTNGTGIIYISSEQAQSLVQLEDSYFHQNSEPIYSINSTVSIARYTFNAITYDVIYGFDSNISVHYSLFTNVFGDGALVVYYGIINITNSQFINNPGAITDPIKAIFCTVMLFNCTIINNTYLFYSIASNFSIILQKWPKCSLREEYNLCSGFWIY